jgi:exodeoxyribonuclease-1
VRDDAAFVGRLVDAAAAGERVFEQSEHVELQIYGERFVSDADGDLCRRFHAAPWEERLCIALQFTDQRLRRLARRLVYFERPDLLEDTLRQAMDNEVARRIRGEVDGSAWLTIPNAIFELDALSAGLDPALCGPMNAYREHLQLRLAPEISAA